MACTSCSTSDGGAPKGCKNNGTCGTDSCNKLTVFDWLSNMSLSNGETPFDCVEIRFKNGRKEFYRNTEKLTLSMGDIVATEASSGHDIGIVTLTGELVRVQMKKGARPLNQAKPPDWVRSLVRSCVVAQASSLQTRREAPARGRQPTKSCVVVGAGRALPAVSKLRFH